MKTTPDMTVSAWRNTPAHQMSGAMFGLRLNKFLRSRLFSQRVPEVSFKLEDGPILKFALEENFWRQCPEFKHPEIGPWMLRQGIPIPWPPGQPPKFTLVQRGPTEFEVKLL